MQHKPLDRILEGAYSRPTDLHIFSFWSFQLPQFIKRFNAPAHIIDGPPYACLFSNGAAGNCPPQADIRVERVTVCDFFGKMTRATGKFLGLFRFANSIHSKHFTPHSLADD